MSSLINDTSKIVLGSSITPTAKQEQGIKDTVMWYKHKLKPIWTIGGYAGCIDLYTKLFTDKGWVTLKEIILSSEESLDFVGFKPYKGSYKIFDGKEFSDISHVYGTDITDGYVIKACCDNKIFCSSIHPFFRLEKVDGKREIRLVKANELKIGDMVATFLNRKNANSYPDIKETSEVGINNLKDSYKFCWTTITSIMPIPNHKFYDITVPSNHRYIANHFFCHNSGKSTLTNFIIDELNLTLDEVAIVAYTGAASVVLIRKGLPAMTIHRLIYQPYEIIDEETKKKKICFKLKDHIDDNIKLIIVDECSMVSSNLLKDLVSFGVPIILQGDPFQLKPVYNEMNDYIKNPDVFLDEPIRQSLDNSIIWFATQLRNYKMPNYGQHGENVHMYNKNEFPNTLMEKANQIISGTNKTCDKLNNIFRYYILGIKSKLPVNGEKLMCIQNNWDLYCDDKFAGETFLVNGLLGIVDNIRYNKPQKVFTMDFQPTYMDDGYFKNIYGDTLYFSDKLVKNDDDYIQENYLDTAVARISLNSKNIKLNYFQFGYCITVYKAQGMETPRVLYFDEMFRKDIYWNHFYTAVTRASEYVDIVK